VCTHEEQFRLSPFQDTILNPELGHAASLAAHLSVVEELLSRGSSFANNGILSALRHLIPAAMQHVMAVSPSSDGIKQDSPIASGERLRNLLAQLQAPCPPSLSAEELGELRLVLQAFDLRSEQFVGAGEELSARETALEEQRGRLKHAETELDNARKALNLEQDRISSESRNLQTRLQEVSVMEELLAEREAAIQPTSPRAAEPADSQQLSAREFLDQLRAEIASLPDTDPARLETLRDKWLQMIAPLVTQCVARGGKVCADSLKSPDAIFLWITGETRREDFLAERQNVLNTLQLLQISDPETALLLMRLGCLVRNQYGALQNRTKVVKDICKIIQPNPGVRYVNDVVTELGRIGLMVARENECGLAQRVAQENCRQVLEWIRNNHPNNDPV
jgi:hypothetical protein